MHDYTEQCIPRCPHGKAGHLDIAESMVRKVRLERFWSAGTCQDECVGRSCRTEIGLIDLAVWSQKLTKFENNDRATLAGGLQATPAGEILAKINYDVACRQGLYVC